MLVVRRVEVGEVRFRDGADEGVGIFLMDAVGAVVIGEDGKRRFDGTHDASEGVAGPAAEGSAAAVVFVESFEDAGGVGMDGGFGEEGARR